MGLTAGGSAGLLSVLRRNVSDVYERGAFGVTSLAVVFLLYIVTSWSKRWRPRISSTTYRVPLMRLVVMSRFNPPGCGARNSTESGAARISGSFSTSASVTAMLPRASSNAGLPCSLNVCLIANTSTV